MRRRDASRIASARPRAGSLRVGSDTSCLIAMWPGTRWTFRGLAWVASSNVGPTAAGACEERAYAGCQAAGLDGLHDVVARTGRECGRLAFAARVRGEHEDRPFACQGVPPEFDCECHASHDRHVDVRDHDVWLLAARFLKSRLTIGRDDD